MSRPQNDTAGDQNHYGTYGYPTGQDQTAGQIITHTYTSTYSVPSASMPLNSSAGNLGLQVVATELSPATVGFPPQASNHVDALGRQMICPPFQQTPQGAADHPGSPFQIPGSIDAPESQMNRAPCQPMQQGLMGHPVYKGVGMQVYAQGPNTGVSFSPSGGRNLPHSCPSQGQLIRNQNANRGMNNQVCPPTLPLRLADLIITIQSRSTPIATSSGYLLAIFTARMACILIDCTHLFFVK